MASPKRMIEKWQKKLFLHEWTIVVEMAPHDMSNEDHNCLATNVADPVYLRATITIYPIFFKQNQKDQEDTIVHELAHCFTQEAWNCITTLQRGGAMPDTAVTPIMERLTQRITNAILSK